MFVSFVKEKRLNNNDNTLEALKSKPERINSLDALRGVAVLGIFILNIIVLGISDVAVTHPLALGGEGAINQALWIFTSIFAEGSMRGLFSLMFGASVILYCTRPSDQDTKPSIRSLYYRRNLLLILFGLVHASLLLNPLDILFVYGIVGLFLYPLRTLSPILLCIAAAVVLTFTIIVWADDLQIEMELSEQAHIIETKVENGSTISEQEQETLDRWRETLDDYYPPAETRATEIAERTGDIKLLYASNDRNDGTESLLELFWWLMDALLMMLIGMAFYKWGILTGKRSTQFYLNLVLITYAVGIAMRTVIMGVTWANDFMPGTSLIMSLSPIGRIAMSIGHVGLFFLLWHLFSSSLIMRALTATGRMALSNYIGQTIVMTLLFTSLGFGLYGQFDRAQLYGIMVLIWVLQLTLSVAWMKRYKMGPLEWVWRMLTYFKILPNRR